jgi:hypothetical protein
MQWILSSKGHLKRDSFLDMKEGSFHKHIYLQHCMCVWKSTYLHCLAFWAQAVLKTHSHLSIFTDLLFVCSSFIQCNGFNVVEVCTKDIICIPTSVKSHVSEAHKTYESVSPAFGNVWIVYCIYIYITCSRLIYCKIFEMEWKFLGSKWGVRVSKK